MGTPTHRTEPGPGIARHDPPLDLDTYRTIYHIAERLMRHERPGHTLQATALVHEAWIRLSQQSTPPERNEFIAHAVQAIRRTLIDHARRRGAGVRGGGHDRASLNLDALEQNPEADPEIWIWLDEALAKLRQLEPRAARVFECRFFAGLGFHEIAGHTGVGERQCHRDWAFARAWLREAFTGLPEAAEGAGT